MVFSEAEKAGIGLSVRLGLLLLVSTACFVWRKWFFKQQKEKPYFFAEAIATHFQRAGGCFSELSINSLQLPELVAVPFECIQFPL